MAYTVPLSEFIINTGAEDRFCLAFLKAVSHSFDQCHLLPCFIKFLRDQIRLGGSAKIYCSPKNKHNFNDRGLPLLPWLGYV